MNTIWRSREAAAAAGGSIVAGEGAAGGVEQGAAVALQAAAARVADVAGELRRRHDDLQHTDGLLQGVTFGIHSADRCPAS